jgi:hypothetical protein
MYFPRTNNYLHHILTNTLNIMLVKIFVGVQTNILTKFEWVFIQDVALWEQIKVLFSAYKKKKNCILLKHYCRSLPYSSVTVFKTQEMLAINIYHTIDGMELANKATQVGNPSKKSPSNEKN